MKALEIKHYGMAGGLVGLIAHSLAASAQPDRRAAAGRLPDEAGLVPPDAEGVLKRLGRWFWRQKRHGVEADLARSRDVFEALDRWLWKQQMRETEAWLAQSADVFELEARMRRLERGPARL